MSPKEAIAISWVEEALISRREWLGKCRREVEAFAAMGPELRPFLESWERTAATAETRVEIIEGLAEIIADREEWRTQHENLLSVRQSDLASLSTPTDGGKR